MILSFQHQVLKPEPQIYWQLLQEYRLKAEECLSHDDVAANVEGARLDCRLIPTSLPTAAQRFDILE